MRWHPNAIPSGIAHPELQAAASSFNGGSKKRRTMKKRAKALTS
jgi:hypothetical protein